MFLSADLRAASAELSSSDRLDLRPAPFGPTAGPGVVAGSTGGEERLLSSDERVGCLSISRSVDLDSMNNGMLHSSAILACFLVAGCFSPNLNGDEMETDAEGNVSTSSDAASTGAVTATSSPATDATSTTEAASTTGSATGGSNGVTTSPTSESQTDSTTESGEGESSTSSTSEDDTGDPTGALPCAESCVREAPIGWNGPVVRGVGEDACSGDFPELEQAAFAGATGDPAECGCTCESPSGGSCANSTTVRAYDASTSSNGSGCNSLTETFPIEAESYIDSNDSGVRFRVAARAVNVAPTCEPSASESVDPVEINGELEICSGASLEGECAASEVCVPSIGGGFVAGYCIWADGTQDCPASSGYTERQVVYTDVTDGRECSPCSCGAAANPTCGGSVSYVVTYNPVGAPFVTVDPEETLSANDSCSTLRTPNDAVETGSVTYNFSDSIEFLEPTASSCSPQGGSPQGAVNAVDAVTVCCVP